MKITLLILVFLLITGCEITVNNKEGKILFHYPSISERMGL